MDPGSSFVVLTVLSSDCIRGLGFASTSALFVGLALGFLFFLLGLRSRLFILFLLVVLERSIGIAIHCRRSESRCSPLPSMPETDGSADISKDNSRRLCPFNAPTS